LPRIFEEVTGEKFPRRADESHSLRAEDWDLLREVCGEDEAFFNLQLRLLDREREFRGLSRRTGVFEALEKELKAGLYSSEEEAVAVLQERERRKNTVPLEVVPAGTPTAEVAATEPRKDE
jgi:DNA sulfur modification protein DndC